ncbi:MAG: hypothetical protein GC179_22145 [Anaerolineaceae bacterium]|nr:hypothetical protein [Anaerolineaceae bacterium]
MKTIADPRRFSIPNFGIPRTVLVLWVLHLVISLGLGFYLQANPELPEAPWFFAPDWASNLAHWDVLWETRIADQGYGPDFSPQTSAKFPLAALSARLLHQTFGFSLQVALFIINKLGTLLGFWALWCLVKRLYDPFTANRAVTYVACSLFGTSFIYWMSYPDPLFLAWWVLAFEALFTGRPYRAGLWATLAVWTRPQGALLLPVFALSILIESLRTHGLKWALFNRAFFKHVLSACLIPSLALIAWVIRVSDVTQIPFSPYVAQQDVRQTGLIWPWQRIFERFQEIWKFPQQLNIGKWLEGYQLALLIILLIVLGVVWWRRQLRWELLVFTILSVFLPLMTALIAIGRFATMTFLPLAFIYIVPTNRRWIDYLLWFTGIILGLLVFVALNIYSMQVTYVP